MFMINKLVGCFISPVGFSMALIGVAVLVRLLGWRRVAGWVVLCAFANIWLWSTPFVFKRLGVALEVDALVDGRVLTVESLPKADVIELHGGGMGSATNVSPYAEMWFGADRVWQAARLWKAGKAPRILVTSSGTDLSTGPLLVDLGVSPDAIIYDFAPRNTEEEVKSVATFFTDHRPPSTGRQLRPKVLVVTSAWHMKRTMLLYRKYAPEVEAIPTPCDFEALVRCGRQMGLSWSDFLPDAEKLYLNGYVIHEIVGYFGYKWFR